MREIRRPFGPRGLAFKAIPTPENPIVGNSQQRDPRNFGVAYDPAIQGDELTRQAQGDRIRRRGLADVASVLQHLDAKDLPPQTTPGAYPVILTAQNVPLLLIPRNIRRVGFIISDPGQSSGLCFSYDAPLTVNGVLMGRPLPTADYEAIGSSVPISDIWVWNRNAAGVAPLPTYPYPVIGWEASLAIEGNER